MNGKPSLLFYYIYMGWHVVGYAVIGFFVVYMCTAYVLSFFADNKKPLLPKDQMYMAFTDAQFACDAAGYEGNWYETTGNEIHLVCRIGQDRQD